MRLFDFEFICANTANGDTLIIVYTIHMIYYSITLPLENISALSGCMYISDVI